MTTLSIIGKTAGLNAKKLLLASSRFYLAFVTLVFFWLKERTGLLRTEQKASIKADTNDTEVIIEKAGLKNSWDVHRLRTPTCQDKRPLNPLRHQTRCEPMPTPGNSKRKAQSAAYTRALCQPGASDNALCHQQCTRPGVVRVTNEHNGNTGRDAATAFILAGDALVRSAPRERDLCPNNWQRLTGMTYLLAWGPYLDSDRMNGRTCPVFLLISVLSKAGRRVACATLADRTVNVASAHPPAAHHSRYLFEKRSNVLRPCHPEQTPALHTLFKIRGQCYRIRLRISIESSFVGFPTSASDDRWLNHFASLSFSAHTANTGRV